MTTIQIAYAVPAVTLTKIEQYLDNTSLRDVNWNGAAFIIERADFTCIPDNTSLDAVQLLYQIQRIIDGNVDLGEEN